MRHLSVPSQETASWRQKLSDKNWLAKGHAIHNLGKERGIPLNEKAPTEFPGLVILDLEPIKTGPKHWTERLDTDLFEKYREYWPMSHDQIGDVVLLKLPNELEGHGKTIADAILAQHSNVRVVCADNGVKGEFRVRDLEVLGHSESSTTLTKVRENGHDFWTDPGKVYYSPRLATERQKNIETVNYLSKKLGRKISVCDPYAGVGPALVPLLKHESVSKIYASDLNPQAHAILSNNLPGAWTSCSDARELSKEIPECCDLLLVNIPHSTLEHLPDLIGLLKKGNEVVVRGWAIVGNDDLDKIKDEIKTIFAKSEIISLNTDSQKSYSPNEIYLNFEVELII